MAAQIVAANNDYDGDSEGELPEFKEAHDKMIADVLEEEK